MSVEESIVEIGASTNFVADELLKSRAGENVVALMSAILPVMSESSCDNLLLRLFQTSATPLDKTPGFGQLRSIRETLTPLARKTPFKDKVFQYHTLARQLLEKESCGLETSGWESIPDENTTAQVILCLAKVMQEAPSTVLDYRGLKGTGWVIAYARHILGLPVCILKSSSNSVPISGDYQAAKVLVYIFERECECRLFTQGQVQDYFLTKSIFTRGRESWLIDADKTNVLDSFIPGTDPMRRGISVIARSMAHELAEVMCKALSSEDRVISPVVGLASYPMHCLATVRDKAQAILEILGFDRGSDESFEPKSVAWSQYFRSLESGQSPGNHSNYSLRPGFEWIGLHLGPGPMWIESHLGHIEVLRNPGKGKKKAREASKIAYFDGLALRYTVYLLRMVQLACTFAFTNWDAEIRVVSLSFLEDYHPPGKHRSPWYMLIKMIMKSPSNAVFTEPIWELFQASMDTIIGKPQSWDLNSSDPSVLAFQHKGFVFAHRFALDHRVDLDACFLYVIPGEIAANGVGYKRIYSTSIL